MDTTQTRVPTFAPLAFSLSIRSEGAGPALARNAVDASNSIIFSTLLASAGAAAVACAAYTLLPAWISIPLAVWPAVKCFKLAKRYFDNEYPKSRIQANRNVLLKVIDAEDAGHFASVVAPIVNSQYGNQQWAKAANEQRARPGADQFLYLATVFTFAPECWKQSTGSVYDKQLKGETPERG
ncbi:hypothetical protein NPS53_07950 [Pseudomonas putida]|uniref:hypothetical protein n=1 Tax=Pseudomonas putida TaxID=303 RepID=UPI002363625D|nr:hypothetical protein [Pseudomonas putida]MDD2139502.1 hypothetical protein [Pseudomonas putida]HDS1721830.1 hypothetical protein [Pseudomonas putida]